MKPDDQATRSVNRKGKVVQMTRPPLHLRGEGPFTKSKGPPASATLKKICPSPKLVPVLVFVPAPIEGDQASQHGVFGVDSLDPIDGRKLTEFLQHADGVPNAPSEETRAVFGDVAVDFLTMEAFRKKERVTLTTLQFRTLRYLTRHARRVISRDELLNEVWGYEHYPTTRTVDNVILKLRQKLETNPSRPVHIRTIYGTGYKFLP